ncbi:MAG TPA: single-stranded-DNA-specific exonuclease RecJ, partial [Phaeodactylibacter sp.]|nr:single-stranded-DNA-specific exonuclease RecJ [Phaeodactylibacter sp.]
LNPQQAGCNYPFKTLCGCGVAFKFLQAVCITQEWAAGEYLSYLDLVATATACDIVPLLDENRVLVYFGLKRLEENARVGFRALIQISERSLPLRVSDLVFGLGPMINAAGRLGDAKESVRLLICTDVQEAQTQARHLQVQNENRKALDQQILNEAIGLLEKKALGNSIVLFDTRWHKGIVGIVASRLVERYHKPTIVLAESAGQAVGSARSVPGVDISSLIGKCDSLLTNYGGHKHAAGLTLPIENVPALQKKIEALLSEETIGDVIIYIAAHITLAEISFELYEKIQSFAPFGPSNRTPVFATEKVLLYGTPRLLKRSHLQFEIISTTGKRYRCIAFSQAHHLSILQEDSPFDICYTLMENNWNGIRSLQLNIKDIRRSEE